MLLPVLSAQILEREVPFTPVRVDATYTSQATGVVNLSLSGGTAALTHSATSVGPQAVAPVYRGFIPGYRHVINVTLASADNGMIQYSPPPGYRVYINDVARTRISGLGVGTTIISVRVELDEIVPFGQASSFRPGRLVWTVGLGRLSNGKSAGSIALREPVWSSNFYQPSSLVYDNANPDAEVTPEINGTRQIYVTSGLVQITAPTADSTQIEFFLRTQIGAKQNGLYIVSGDPLYKYLIDREYFGSGLRITRTIKQGGMVRVDWTQMNYDQNVGDFFLMDWVAKPAGATSVQSSILKWWHNNTISYSRGGSQEWQESRTYTSDGELSSVSAGGYPNTRSKSTGFIYDGKRVISQYSADLGTPSSRSFSYHSDVDRRDQLSSASAPFGQATAVGQVIHATAYEYSADWTGRKILPSLIRSYRQAADDTALAKAEFSYNYEDYEDNSRIYSGNNGTLKLVTQTRKDYYDGTHYLTTVTKSFREDTDSQFRFFPGLPHSVLRADGSMTVTLYFRGVFNTTGPGVRTFTASRDGPELMTVQLNGTSTAAGTTALSSFTVGDQTQSTEGNFRLLPNVSTAEATMISADGTVLCKQTSIYTGSGWQIVTRDVHSYVDGVFLASITRDSGDASAIWPVVTNTWTKGRLDTTTDENGVRTEFEYDEFNRVAIKRVTGATAAGASIPSLTTTFEYNAADLITKETVSSSGTGETLITARTYDTGGRVLTETKPGYATAGQSSQSAVVTSFSHHYSSDQQRRVLTTTFPSGSTRVEEFAPDGQLQFVAGTGVVPETYEYLGQTDGLLKTTIFTGSDASPRKRESWTDMLGRPVKNSRPGFTGQVPGVESNVYDDHLGGNTGRLIKTTKTGVASTLFEYNALSQPIRSGLDLDGGGTLVLASGDRVTDSLQVYESFDNDWWHTSIMSQYPFTGDAAVKEVSRIRKRLTGLTATLRAETRTYDAEGNETRVTVTVDAVTKLVTVTTTRPGMAQAQVEKSLNGSVIETTGHDGLTYKKRYDALGRLAGEIDPRTGTENNHSTKYTYHPNTTWVKEVKDAANKRLSHTDYDGAGRVVLVKDAFDYTTRTAYTARGEVEKVWGSGTYPVSYVYNSYGERTAMRTYRDPNNAALTDTSTFPSLGTYDETTWEFDAPSGLLKKKTDAKGKFVEYTYNLRGQTYERFWSRIVSGSSPAVRVKATFSYDSATGENTGIAYNDGTAPVTYSYTRSGQIKTVTDVAGARDFVYHGTTPWRLDYEDLPATGGTFFYGDRLLTRTYDSATSTSAGTLWNHTKGTVLGRTSGLRLGSPSTPASDLEFSYPTSNAGRIAGVVSNRNNGTVSRTFSYDYAPSSALLQNLRIEGGHAFALNRTFIPDRDLVQSVEALWGSQRRTKFVYAYDDRRQRQSVVQAGDVFNDYGGGSGDDAGAIHLIFTYNGRGELTGAGTFLGAAATDQTQPLSARKHEFDYDGIGNRRSSNTSGNSALRDDYTVNELNQYTLRENNTLAVGGTVADDANIKVAAGDAAVALAGRRGRHWGDNIAVENWVAPFQGPLNIYAVNPLTNKKMVETRTAFLPPLAQAMSYDEDGNISNDGVWTYEWDAENRLRSMEATANAVAGGVPKRRFEFRYDYQHRRIEKLVLTHNGTAWTVDANASRRFLYDGWSMIAEFKLADASSVGALLRSYTWGLDIAKSLTDAGGVGALLQIRDYTTNKDYLPSYDGNGNVVALFDADASSSATACVAAYEYSPYGEFLRCEGAYAKENPFRFSTKFTDDETGLVYYGRRYYSPSQGRFLGRDPIEETGGLNLYGFAGNSPLNAIDVMGLIPAMIGGRLYDVTAVPASRWTTSAANGVYQSGGMWTANPSTWGLSFSFFYQSGSGFNFSISPQQHYYVALPLNIAPSSTPPPAATIINPINIVSPRRQGSYNATNTRTLGALVENFQGGISRSATTRLFFNADAPQAPSGGRLADGRHFTRTAGSFNSPQVFYGQTSEANSYVSLMDHIRYGMGGYDTMVFVDHGNIGGLYYGGQYLTDSDIGIMAGKLSPDGLRNLIFLGCDIGESAVQTLQVAYMASAHNVNIYVSTGSVLYNLQSGFDPSYQSSTSTWLKISPGGQGAATITTIDQYGNQVGLQMSVGTPIPVQLGGGVIAPPSVSGSNP